MGKLLLILSLVALSAPAQAQIVNEYDQCTRTREIYTPGYYNVFGQWINGDVRYERYNVPCNTSQVPYNRYNRYNNQLHCDPTRSTLGAILGGGIAASMSRGDGYKWSVPLGAFIGGVGFGCN